MLPPQSSSSSGKSKTRVFFSLPKTPRNRYLFYLILLLSTLFLLFTLYWFFIAEDDWYGNDDIQIRIEKNDLLLGQLVRQHQAPDGTPFSSTDPITSLLHPIIRINPYRDALFTSSRASYYLVSKLFSLYENHLKARSQRCRNQFEASCLKEDFVTLLGYLKEKTSTNPDQMYLILEDDVILCNNILKTVQQFSQDKENCLYACGVGGTCILMKHSCLETVMEPYKTSPKRHMDMVLWGSVKHKYRHSADHFAMTSTMGHKDGRKMKCSENL